MSSKVGATVTSFDVANSIRSVNISAIVRATKGSRTLPSAFLSMPSAMMGDRFGRLVEEVEYVTRRTKYRSSAEKVTLREDLAFYQSDPALALLSHKKHMNDKTATSTTTYC